MTRQALVEIADALAARNIPSALAVKKRIKLLLDDGSAGSLLTLKVEEALNTQPVIKLVSLST